MNHFASRLKRYGRVAACREVDLEEIEAEEGDLFYLPLPAAAAGPSLPASPLKAGPTDRPETATPAPSHAHPVRRHLWDGLGDTLMP